MPLVAKYIYFRPAKILHPYYLQIGDGKSGLYFRGVFATLDEAIKQRDAILRGYD
mgnify:CR=1 FL=1|jgi:hypothetical protein